MDDDAKVLSKPLEHGRGLQPTPWVLLLVPFGTTWNMIIGVCVFGPAEGAFIACRERGYGPFVWVASLAYGAVLGLATAWLVTRIACLFWDATEYLPESTRGATLFLLYCIAFATALCSVHAGVFTTDIIGKIVT